MASRSGPVRRWNGAGFRVPRAGGSGRAGLLAWLFAVAGCSSTMLNLPAARSPLDHKLPRDGLWAGFARADLTPPPGFLMAGNGTEGRQALGWRHRLWARAMVLDDARGERLAIVQLDLGHPSPVVHRMVAARTVEAGTGIGSDRLFLAHTHTHSGPGNIAATKGMNAFNAPLAAYDPFLVDFLVEQISTAVIEAVEDLGPARAAWGRDTIDGATINRSIEAHRLNYPGGSVIDAAEAVDDTLLLLRVDRCADEARTDCWAKGAFSVFAIHSTSYSAANFLADGDIHSVVARALERHIEDASGGRLERRFDSQAFHLFANGAEGDVAPALVDDGGSVRLYPPESRCENFYRHRRGRRAGGPRSPAALERWLIPSDALTDCLEAARRATSRNAGRIHDVIERVYDRLGDSLTADLPLGRAYSSVQLRGSRTPYPLCDEPRVGLPFAAGSDELRSRFYDWKILGLFHSGITEGDLALDRDHEGCQGAKLVLGGPLQPAIIGATGLPRAVDLAVIRIGDLFLAAVPVEATTQVGQRLKERVHAALDEAARLETRKAAPLSPGSIGVGILGLTNNYLLYAATAEEYEAQHYEGGATLYGPNTAEFLAHHLARLARSVVSVDPLVRVAPRSTDPGTVRSYFRRPTEPSQARPREITPSCGNGVLRVWWIDSHPGALRPSDGPLVKIEGPGIDPNGIWDDREEIEIRALGPSRGGYAWQMTLRDARSGSYTVTLVRSGDSVGAQCP